ncbi:MAG: ParB/RepB/Spo0J family partition protein [Micrococcus sp.]|nr:ParB/RepB/Spo0J family partition protein [Micrococcus sp.]
MKKSRRGLGRGLEALIQSTVPEEEISDDGKTADIDSVDSDAITVGISEKSHTAAENSSSMPATVPDEVTPSGESKEPSSTEEPETPEVADEPETAAGTTPTERSPEDVAGRYLGGASSADTKPTVRETRRPVDVFFPDRRAEASSSAQSASESSSTGPTANGRKRPAMPPVSPRTLRAPLASVGDRGNNETDQPTAVDKLRSAEAAASHGESTVTGHSSTQSSGTSEDAELRSLPVLDIHPNPRQPREVFDEEDMEELVASIREVGVLQPIVVRPVDGPSPYELVMGERRWRASQRAGLATIPAIVRHTADTALLRDALLENLHRSQLNPLEEAAAYEQLLEDFDCTQDELSSRIGRSRPQISNTLRLLKLPPLVQRRVASGVLSAGHARALLGLVDPAEMEKLAQKIVSEGLSVRATEELVSLHDGIRKAKPKPRASRSDRHERLDYLANTLTDQLDTTVRITLGARKGKIAIDFASVEDLNRIMALINPSGSNASQA